MSGARLQGKCKWFDRKKGYGFIECEGNADIFVHQTEVRIDGFRALYPDQEVEFGIQETGPNGRPCATEVTGPSGNKLANSRGTGIVGRGGFEMGRGGRGGRGRGRGRGAYAGGIRRDRKLRNGAFIFIKPHAVTDQVKDLVSQTLREKGFTIAQEGSLTAEEIDSKKLIDQHYYAIASKATILKPEQLAVPADMFEKTFGLSWAKALESKQVFNAMDGCKELGVDAEQLNTLWAECKKAKKLVKFGGGFYCGKIEVKGKPAVYIFNGFFMSMRSKFTAPGTSIYYYVVHWNSERLNWSDFRANFLGPTDPVDAPKDSLRGQIYTSWKELGLKEEPNVGDNGVHASASPFEALSERLNWLQLDTKDDVFGRVLMRAGITDDTINDWTRDPQVNLPEGGTGSLFDALEDLDSQECVDKCKLIAGVVTPAE